MREQKWEKKIIKKYTFRKRKRRDEQDKHTDTINIFETGSNWKHDNVRHRFGIPIIWKKSFVNLSTFRPQTICKTLNRVNVRKKRRMSVNM